VIKLKKLFILGLMLLALTGCNEQKPEEPNTKVEQNTQTEPEKPKYSGPTTVDHLNLNENIEVIIDEYHLMPFTHNGVCNNVVDTYGVVGAYGERNTSCYSHEVSEEAIEYLSNTPYIKYNGLDEVDGYQMYVVEYLFFPDGRFRTEYILPECYWGQLTPELNVITEKIHAYNIDNSLSDSKRVILDENICEEFKLNCDRWEVEESTTNDTQTPIENE